MIQPTAYNGRLIPSIDFEGDDHRPAGTSQFVTCGESSLAMAAYWATNGRVAHDGQAYRASYPAAVGVDYPHLNIELQRMKTGLALVQPKGWEWGNCSWHMTQGGGLIAMGWYSALPAVYREQAIGVDFLHFIFGCYYSTTSGVRLMDPLNKNTASYGKWVPAAAFRAFIESTTKTDVSVAFIDNQPLNLVLPLKPTP